MADDRASSSERHTVLVTGAAGFLGRYVVAGLLQDPQHKIIAMDMIPADKISAIFSYSHRILPLQFDLESLLGGSDFALNCFKDTLRGVHSVIHVAGIVDTRETAAVTHKLDRVNVQATSVLVDIAAECGVSSFVHISSVGAIIESKLTVTVGLKAWIEVLGLRSSMLSTMKMSTYGKTKLAAERIVLAKGATTTGLKVAVLRPHVVWGRGDTLSTEVLLNWNPNHPEISIGDPSTPVISGRVDIVAAYILMAHTMLCREGGERHTGSVFNIGDSESTLKGVHTRIASCRHVKNTPCNVVAESAPLPASPDLRIHVLNTYAVVLILALLEWAQYLLPSWVMTCLSFLSTYSRLLTANNFAYSSQQFVSSSGLSSFKSDCESLFCKSRGLAEPIHSASVEAISKWKMSLPSDQVVMSKDWLQCSLQTSDVPDSRFTGYCVDTALSSGCHLGPIPMYNRVIKAATFECMAGRNGVPTDELARFHGRNAAGGVGMTVVAYASVSNDGRSFPTQICLNSGDPGTDLRTEVALRKLCCDVHATRNGALAALQLTHAGAFADATFNGGRPARGPSAILNPLTLKHSISLDNDSAALERIEEDFVKAVDFCRKVGFDAIEVHLGHGYLLSQFLSAATNPNKSAADRLVFPLRVLKAVCTRAHTGDKYIAVLVKFNVSELRESDLSLDDARLFARAFADAGADLLVPSGGHVMVNGLHMLRGGRPLREMAAAQNQRFKSWVISLFGKYFVKKEEFREAFFRERVISVMLGAGVAMSKVCLVGGVHELKTADCAVRQDGFLSVQLGRVLLADPDWCLKVGAFKPGQNEKNKSRKADLECVKSPLKVCDNSNRCIVGATMALEPLRCTKHGEVPDW